MLCIKSCISCKQRVRMHGYPHNENDTHNGCTHYDIKINGIGHTGRHIYSLTVSHD